MKKLIVCFYGDGSASASPFVNSSGQILRQLEWVPRHLWGPCMPCKDRAKIVIAIVHLYSATQRFRGAEADTSVIDMRTVIQTRSCVNSLFTLNAYLIFRLSIHMLRPIVFEQATVNLKKTN